MSPASLEERLFEAYLSQPGKPWSIRHTPTGNESLFIISKAPFVPGMPVFLLLIPYNWKDSRRIYEVGYHIARVELRIAERSALDRVVNPAETQQQDLTASEIADRLIAPRPWVEDMVRQHGTSSRALGIIARSISVPTSSIRTMLTAPASPVADSIHRRIREATGYPWFLPEHLRNHYPIDRW
jgi:hypothetical protein